MSLSTAQLKLFADFIQKELGIVYSSENYFQLEKRLVEISRQLNMSSVEDVFTKAQNGISGFFKQMLLDVTTNNETSFFRDPKAFKVIENHVIPGVRNAFPHLKVIRIWSAASSFGQEPYSLAMMLHEMSQRDPKLPRFEIVATDISQAALTRAREGKFTQLEVQRGLPAQMLVKHFSKSSDNHWLLKPEIRVAVQFRVQNLLESFGALGDFEVVLCRNVLIYQTDSKKKEIVDNIARRIQPGGFLLLGAAESLLGVSNQFDQVCRDGAVYFQRKGATSKVCA